MFALLIIPIFFVLASCSPEADNIEPAITGVSFEKAAAADSFYLGFFPQQKVIILTKTDDTAPDTATVQFELSPKTSLLINGEVIEGSTYDFDLEYSERFYTVTLTTGGGKEQDYRLNLYAEAEITTVSSDYQNTAIDLESQSISIEYHENTPEEKVVLSFSLSLGASFSLDSRLLEDPSTVNIPLDLDYTTPLRTTNILIQSADKQNSTDYQIVLNYKPFFSFATGSEENHTHPDAHFLAGYFQVNEEVEDAVAYAVALPSTEAAPADFAGLKTKATAITHYPASYPVETGKAQWFPLLDLTKQTEYKIYLGVEYTGGSKDNLANPITQSTADYDTTIDWGMLGSRDIKAYLGQTIIMTAILRVDSPAAPSWAQRGEEVRSVSQGYAVAVNIMDNATILGETGFHTPRQYHIKIEPLKGDEEAPWRVANFGYSSSEMFSLEILDN